ncbi:class I SAM-dependent methyltransferase [Duganella sp. sic0402]|uniref:class I SAM-dependent methyltransferase n=1 Tax=Duganella sp. sic0402 TaxID=2854786 RepID=UPI001C43DEA2|nr:class I SAM-dependent methyltransferase [Duganella sp. sic0402]MBV7536961.1 class I SAM-dependent methyltransferase [Duganella sp. sic0402]
MTHPVPPKPSAWITATARAAHQLYDAPLVLNDPLALRILGAEHEAELRADAQRQQHPLAVAMRATMAVRARLAEDSIQGVQQYVILGAGLDTYAYRESLLSMDSRLCGNDGRVYEVDLPAMQRWKRDCLCAAGIAEPEHVRYVASDFSEASLMEDLLQAGFDAAQPACFSWLGVSMYLKPDQVMQTLGDIANCAPGSSIVFDYCVQRQHLTAQEQAGLEFIAVSLAAQGEHLHSSFEPQLLEHMLRYQGFCHVEHFGPEQLGALYGAQLSGIFRLIRATV